MVTKHEGATRRAGGSLGLVVLAMTIGNAIILVSQTAVPLTLPLIMSEFGVNASSAQWVVTASILPLAGFMVLGGRLADLLGNRRVFVAGSLLFAAASLLSGLAPGFELLVGARVLQGIGGAMLLPTSVSIVAAAAAAKGGSAGRALGTVGGASAVAGACGPIIGGVLASWIGWRAVMLVNVPLAVGTALIAIAVVAADAPRAGRARVDLAGAALLCVGLVGIVFAVTQSQDWGWGSPGVLVPLGAAVLALVAFVVVERSVASPLVDFGLFRKYPNYAGAVVSQGVGGVVEMGLAVIFPLLLILNLGLDPAAAGLALLPTTLPMVVVAPLAGRWYDRVGGRIPLATGFGLLALAGLALYLGAAAATLPALIPGLLLYGVGLSIVLTVNDPVSLDQVPEADHGQASGVSGTAEQFGGALGIAGLYVVFHSTYLAQLDRLVDDSTLPDLDSPLGSRLRDHLLAAEQSGLNPATFPPDLAKYLQFAFDASVWGYAIAFLVAGVLALAGGIAVTLLVRRVPAPAATGPAGSAAPDATPDAPGAPDGPARRGASGAGPDAGAPADARAAGDPAASREPPD